MTMEIDQIVLLVVLVYFLWMRLLSYKYLREYEQQSALELHNTDFLFCSKCKSFFHDGFIFCSNCFRIKNDALTQPDRIHSFRPIDFVGTRKISIGRNVVKCPHCKYKIPLCGRHKIASPIICCPKCNQYCIDTYMYEWSVLSRRSKLRFLYCSFILDNLDCAAFVLFICFFYKWYIGLLVALIWVGCCIFSLKRKQSLTDESQKRLLANPEYPELLHKMGYDQYISMDKRFKL